MTIRGKPWKASACAGRSCPSKTEMNYELAKQLNDAGFPQGGKGAWTFPPQNLVARSADRIYVPTLSELIEACSDGAFMLLTKGDGVWAATVNGKLAEGPTAEEAVAKIWLALNFARR
jgi:hypothetical protein